MDFLKSLFKNQNPNEEIDNLNQLIESNKKDIQAPWEMQANESLLRERLANAQPYPMAPMDVQRDQFSALSGVLPDENTQLKTDVQYANSPMDPNPEIPNILASMLSPQGIQRPIYNYNQSPVDNANLGSTMSDPNLIEPKQPVQSSRGLAVTPIKNKAQKSTPPEQQEDRSMEALSKDMPQAAPQLQERQQSSILDELLKAQESKNQNNALLAMMEAADQIGTSVSGQGNLQYQKGAFDYLKGMANQPVEDLTQKQKFKTEEQEQQLRGYSIEKAKQQMADEKAKSDPNSDVSKLTRQSVLDSLQRIGRNDLAEQITPNMSSKQIEDIFGQYNLQNMVTAYEAQQNRMEMAKMRADEKSDIKTQKLDKEKQDFITQRYDKLTQGQTYKSMSKMAQAKRLIDQAVANPSGIQDVGALYSLIKMFDPESVVKEGELKLTDSARSVWGRANTLASKMGKNPRVLDKKTLQEIQKAANLIYGEAQQQYKMQVKPVLDQAKKRGIDESEYSMIDPLYDEMKTIEKANIPAAEQFEVDQDALAKEMKRRGL